MRALARHHLHGPMSETFSCSLRQKIHIEFAHLLELKNAYEDENRVRMAQNWREAPSHYKGRGESGEHKEKYVRNPKTNEKIFKKKSYKIHFKIGKILHKKLNPSSNNELK